MSDSTSLDLPAGFFSDLPAPTAGRLPGAPTPSRSAWQPQKAMAWYDAIIDLILAEPGISLKDMAAKLDKHPVTVGLIVRSDIFQARLAIRRAAFNEHLNQQTVQKITRVAHKALDLTLEVMEKKGDNIPLKQVAEIATSALDKLGYGGSSRSDSAGITINNQVTAAAQSVATPSALEKAREHMRTLQAMRTQPAPSLLHEGGSDEQRFGEGEER